MSYIKISGNGFERVAEAALPDTTTHTQKELETLMANYSSFEEFQQEAIKILGAHPQSSMANGNYVLCDRENRVYSNSGWYFLIRRLTVYIEMLQFNKINKR